MGASIHVLVWEVYGSCSYFILRSIYEKQSSSERILIEGLLSIVVVTFISPSGGICHYQRLAKQMKIEAREYNNSYHKPSKLTDSVKSSQTLTQFAADSYGWHSLRGWPACVSLFQGANLLLFTPCSTTCAPFNLHCCSRSLFQSAVVLIASP